MYSAVVAKVDVSVSVHTAEYNIQQGWGFPPVMAFLHRADLGTVGVHKYKHWVTKGTGHGSEVRHIEILQFCRSHEGQAYRRLSNSCPCNNRLIPS